MSRIYRNTLSSYRSDSNLQKIIYRFFIKLILYNKKNGGSIFRMDFFNYKKMFHAKDTFTKRIIWWKFLSNAFLEFLTLGCLSIMRYRQRTKSKPDSSGKEQFYAYQQYYNNIYNHYTSLNCSKIADRQETSLIQGNDL
jgi:hypothetical protein